MARVTTVIENFRRALIAMTAFADTVGVIWQDEDAYDEWDNIATCLFQTLVSDVLVWDLPEAEHDQFNLPEYDLLQTAYDHRSLLLVKSVSEDRRLVFIAFSSTDEAFDTVRCLEVDMKGVPLTGNALKLDIKEVQFYLTHQSSEGILIFR